MKRTKIISAFPGTGKSYLAKLENHSLGSFYDCDSSSFSWIETKNGKERNPDFPNNYIQHIQESIGKYDYIFVSSHKQVREALLNNCIFFYLFYPRLCDKDKYIKRYTHRGNDQAFINLINDNWENWITEIMDDEQRGFVKIKMLLEFIEDELIYLKNQEEIHYSNN